MDKILVGIVMGSTSDLETVEETCKLLQKFEIGYEVKVLSAHRTIEATMEYANSAYDRGLKLIIAAAGGAAHLAGVIAGCTCLPVIGIPIKTDMMGGMDSLLSIVQMPAGVPVATVAVGKAGAKNAAVLALEIIQLVDNKYHEILVAYKKEMKDKVLSNNK